MQLVAAYPAISQFENGESAYRCGPFTVALQKAAGKSVPTFSPQETAILAHDLYVQYVGPDTPADHAGTSLSAWYEMLEKEGITYEKLETISESTIAAQLILGRAVAVTVDETSVYDQALEDMVPYAWKASGTHIITIAGETPSAWLCCDTANIGARGLRSWPRAYEKKSMVIHLATAILFSWLHPTSYTIERGDTLWEIGQRHNTSAAWLYNKNEALIEQTAHEHGYQSSQNGKWIFPGTVLAL